MRYSASWINWTKYWFIWSSDSVSYNVFENLLRNGYYVMAREKNYKESVDAMILPLRILDILEQN